MTERQPSELIRDYGQFELRQYPTHILVEVEVTGDFASAGSRAFRPLVNYISGKNSGDQNIAMTAPVAQSTIGADRYLVTFVLPAGTDPATVPAPRDANVRVRAVEPYDAAVVGFSGGWSQSRFQTAENRLRDAVLTAGLEPSGDAIYARFDPPWKPGFMKYSEVILPVHGAAATS
jgi:hypothetical protein